MAVSGVLSPVVAQLQAQIAQLGSKIATLERSQRNNYTAQNTTIENGGSITVNDSNGNPALVIGGQSDGTITTKVIGQVVPPKAPSTPVAGGGINGIWLSWDGLMADGTTPLADFSAIQVHVSATTGFTPSADTLQGHMLGAGLFGVGPLTPGTTYYVVLQALNDAGQLGPVSTQASAIPLSVPSAISPGTLSGLTIQTGTITTAQIAAAAGILGSQIANGTLTSANILAGSITTALLAANLVIAGAVDGTTITGSTLRNSAIDPKTSINPDGSITITNEASTTIFSIGDDGTIDWYSQSGQLLMELQPGGTQLIYASLTGPSGWSFEPDTVPSVTGMLTSAVSSATYTVPVAVPAAAGSAMQVFASSSGATAATGVTDSRGNVYSLTQTSTGGTYLQVFRCDSLTDGLTTSDTITVTYAAANTQIKIMLATSAAGLASTSLQDFQGVASGTSTAPSVTASTAPGNTGDLVLFAVASPTAPTAIADGWTQLAQANTSGGTWLTLYYSTTVSAATVTASATIASGAWGVVLLGLSPAPPQPVSLNSWAGVSATIAVTSLWAGDGSFSLRVKSSSAIADWGAVSPLFSVQGGASVSMQCQVEAPAALAGVTCGFYWYDVNHSQIGTNPGDNGTVACAAGSVTQFTVSGAVAPAQAVWGQFYVTDSDATANLVMNVDAVQVPGGLVYSNSPAGGTDKFGNVYEQGINFIGLPGLTNVFGVENPYGAQLMGIDAGGNLTAQTISASVDINLAGNSLINDVLPGVGGGGQVIGFPNAYTGSQYPATSVGNTETALYWVSAQVTPGRAYLVQTSNFRVQTSVASAAIRLRIRGTTDGSQPILGSDVLMSWFGNSDSVGSVASPLLSKVFICPAGVTQLNLLVSLQAGTSGQTAFLNQYSNSTFNLTDNQLFVIDMSNGAVVNNWQPLSGGVGGGGTQTSKFYGIQSWSYYGGGSLRTHNGTMYQGQASGATTGSQYSYIDFTNAQSAVTGTVNWMTLRLDCLRSWYNTGMTVGLYQAGSVNNRNDMTIGPVDQWHIGEGQTLTHTLASAVATNMFGALNFQYIALGPNPWQGTSLEYYGYFYGAAGGSTDFQPLLTVNWTS